MLFNLTNKILNEKKINGMLTAIVCGKFGIGKSMYCIKTAYQLYRELGYSEKDGWLLALDAVVFKPEDFGEKLQSEDIREIIIMDDASVHIGSDLYQRYSKLYVAYKQALTTIRTRTGCLLYNCPNPEELAKFIRNSDAYQIFIAKGYNNNDYTRVATAWGWRRISTKGGMRRIQARQWKDNFSCHIPKKYYKLYLEKREKYIEKPIEVLIEGDEISD